MLWLAVFALAAAQAAAVPKAMASFDHAASATQMSGMSGCGSCDQQNMADDTCGPICAPTSFAMPPALASKAIAWSINWLWDGQALPGRLTSPEITPPRS